ncbi:hypothetical protein ACP4OV_021917 [Aristida adscensionis]
MEAEQQQQSIGKAATDAPVKQEVEEPEETGAGALVAVQVPAPMEEALTVRIDKAKLHCPLCTLPLRPPIFQFQCEAGHLACGACHGRLPKARCYACGHAGAYRRNATLEDVVGWYTVPCPYDAYGCGACVAYHDAGEHQRACPCAPCACPEPGCGFVGSPPVLRGHLAAAPHSWRVHGIGYGKTHHLRLAPGERRLLVAPEPEDGGGGVFVVAVSALWDGAYHGASVECVRASAAAGPRYTCSMWATGPPSAVSGRPETNMTQVMDVPSSAVPGEATAEEGVPLVLRRKNLHGASMEMHLSVRIDKVKT